MDNNCEVGRISPFSEVKNTTYGGRACFSAAPLEKGTVVLEANDSVGTCVTYDFRKEVCHNCYTYQDGKTMKFKMTYPDIAHLVTDEVKINAKKFNGAGLWFCSEACKLEFLTQPHVIELIACYELLLSVLKMMQKRAVDELQERSREQITEDVINHAWLEVIDSWIPKIDKMKLSKKMSQLPDITEEEYNCARFVIKSLFTLKYLDPESQTKAAFKTLQSNELSKIARFPILLDFQILIFKTLYIILPGYTRQNLSVKLFRHILGSEYGNAFGIWEQEELSENREFLGYAVYPRASYFNHSCDPNLTKSRIKGTMVFTANKDVPKGEPLCIDYSGLLSHTVLKRRQLLKENWFFECCCTRCESELQAIH